MKRFILTVFAMMLGCAAANSAQPHHFHAHFSSWDGLPEAYLSSVCEDAFGRIWIGSKDGVFYYTGEEFVPFTNADYLAHCTAVTQAVRLDADGCVWITGRASRTIVLSSGKKVAPEELEALILAIPGVLEAVVTGGGEMREIKAEIYGSVPESFILRAVGQLNLELPVYKRIKRTIVRTEPFPRTASGKIRIS